MTHPPLASVDRPALSVEKQCPRRNNDDGNESYELFESALLLFLMNNFHFRLKIFIQK